MKPDQVLKVVDGRGPCPLFLPQDIIDAIERCHIAREFYEADQTEFSSEGARLVLADAILERAKIAGVQVCR